MEQSKKEELKKQVDELPYACHPKIFDFFLSIIESDREKIQALTERLEKIKALSKYNSNHDELLYQFQDIGKLLKDFNP